MTVTIEASTLRRAAETADGTRNRDVWLLIGASNFKLVECGTEPGTGEILIQCLTKDKVRPDLRPKIEEINLKSKKTGANGKEHKLHELYDAVFWTESAVEKFVYPYYTYLYRHQACKRLCLLQEAWESPNVVAVAHLPKSEPFPVDGKRLGLGEDVVRLETEHVILVDDEETGQLKAYIPEHYVLKFLR